MNWISSRGLRPSLVPLSTHLSMPLDKAPGSYMICVASVMRSRKPMQLTPPSPRTDRPSGNEKSEHQTRASPVYWQRDCSQAAQTWDRDREQLIILLSTQQSLPASRNHQRVISRGQLRLALLWAFIHPLHQDEYVSLGRLENRVGSVSPHFGQEGVFLLCPFPGRG